MLKRLILVFLVTLAACNNQPSPSEKDVKNTTPVKSRARTVKPAASPWTTGSYAPKEGETEGRKFVRLVTEGDFSDSTQNKSILYAEVIVNKANAGILLHEVKKSSPAQKFTEPVQIKMADASGQELQMTSARSWNSSGGIMIERNNNDYSRFRIFLLQCNSPVTVEIKGPEAKIYNFVINTDGFSDSFNTL
jgi:hypothetical protein